MPFWAAIVILLAAAAGGVFCARRIQNRRAKWAAVGLCVLVALAAAVYAALTVLLVSAVK